MKGIYSVEWAISLFLFVTFIIFYLHLFVHNVNQEILTKIEENKVYYSFTDILNNYLKEYYLVNFSIFVNSNHKFYFCNNYDDYRDFAIWHNFCYWFPIVYFLGIDGNGIVLNTPSNYSNGLLFMTTDYRNYKLVNNITKVVIRNNENRNISNFAVRIELPVYLWYKNVTVCADISCNKILNFCYNQSDFRCNKTPSREIWVKIPYTLGSDENITLYIMPSKTNNAVNGKYIFDFYEDFTGFSVSLSGNGTSNITSNKSVGIWNFICSAETSDPKNSEYLLETGNYLHVYVHDKDLGGKKDDLIPVWCEASAKNIVLDKNYTYVFEGYSTIGYVGIPTLDNYTLNNLANFSLEVGSYYYNLSVNSYAEAIGRLILLKYGYYLTGKSFSYINYKPNIVYYTCSINNSSQKCYVYIKDSLGNLIKDYKSFSNDIQKFIFNISLYTSLDAYGSNKNSVYTNTYYHSIRIWKLLNLSIKVYPPNITKSYLLVVGPYLNASEIYQGKDIGYSTTHCNIYKIRKVLLTSNYIYFNESNEGVCQSSGYNNELSYLQYKFFVEMLNVPLENNSNDFSIFHLNNIAVYSLHTKNVWNWYIYNLYRILFSNSYWFIVYLTRIGEVNTPLPYYRLLNWTTTGGFNSNYDTYWNGSYFESFSTTSKNYVLSKTIITDTDPRGDWILLSSKPKAKYIFVNDSSINKKKVYITYSENLAKKEFDTKYLYFYLGKFTDIHGNDPVTLRKIVKYFNLPSIKVNSVSQEKMIPLNLLFSKYCVPNMNYEISYEIPGKISESYLCGTSTEQFIAKRFNVTFVNEFGIYKGYLTIKIYE